MVHLSLLGAALVFAYVGAFAVIRFHSLRHIPHFYSLHSWFGIVTLAVFTIQVRACWALQLLAPACWAGATRYNTGGMPCLDSRKAVMMVFKAIRFSEAHPATDSRTCTCCTRGSWLGIVTQAVFTATA